MRAFKAKCLYEISLNKLVDLTYNTIENGVFNANMTKNLSFTNASCNIKRKRNNSETMDDLFNNSNSDLMSGNKRIKLDDNRFNAIFSAKISQNSENENSNDLNKNAIPKKITDPVITLRIYLNCLTYSLWNKFAVLILKRLFSAPGNVKNLLTNPIIELLCCNKLQKVSIEMINCLEPSQLQELFKRLSFCRNLTSLDYNMDNFAKLHFGELFFNSIARLVKLRRFLYISNHEALKLTYTMFSIITKFQFLQNLTIFYDSSILNKDLNISCLKYCKMLTEVSLYSYGKGCEANYLVDILQNLENLHFIYHRELPNALMQIYLENTGKQLKLKSISLVASEKKVGSQLVYIQTSMLQQIAILCPFISDLILIKASNLTIVFDYILRLNSLTLHDSQFSEALKESVLANKLKYLLSLRLTNCDVPLEYIDILSLSKGCPRIEILEIFNSNLTSDIVCTTQFDQVTTPLFPNIKKLVLLSRGVHMNDDSLVLVTPSKWALGLTMLSRLLTGATFLELIYIQPSSKESIIPSEYINSGDLLSHLIQCPSLKELLIYKNPKITCHFMQSLTDNCKSLRCLFKIDLWSFESSKIEKEIKNNFDYLLN